jgi:3-oxoacyl-[acyl-carrier-protein] synthase-3
VSAIRVVGTGSSLPRKVLTNSDLEAGGLDTSDEWIVRRTGVRERRIADPDVATSDLGHAAALAALERAGLGTDALDLIIVATITPDTCCPSAANWLQAKLGATQARSFDVAAACSGFVFGLDVASQYLRSGAAGTVLVVAAEIMSRTLDWTDRSTCILWGDGAGAAVLTGGTEGSELLSTAIHSDGSGGQDLLLPGGGSRTTPISHESVDRGLHSLRMHNANLSIRVAVRYFVEAIREAAAASGVSVDDVDWFIPHQANARLLEATARAAGVPFEKFYLTLQKYGNISSASCAIALDEAARDGTLRPGDLVCVPVFGGGLTWGSAMVRW